MRTTYFILLVAISSLLSAFPVAAVVITPGSAQVLQNALQPNSTVTLQDLTLVVPEGVDVPALLTEPVPNVLVPMDAGEAAGLNVPGMTGGLTHPACVAETARRAAMNPPQPPPHGDFPCMVPTSNSSGIVDGVCFVHECRGVASTGLGGLMSALGNISSLGSIVSSLLQNLLQPKPSSPSDGGVSTLPPQTPATPQSTSVLITGTPLTELDMSRLFNDSATIVGNLLGALNP